MVSGSANGIRVGVWEKVSWKAVKRLMDGLDLWKWSVKKRSGKERRKQGKNWGTKRRELKQIQPLSYDTELKHQLECNDKTHQVVSLYLSNWLVLVRRNCGLVALAVVVFRIMNTQLLVKLALIVKWALARWDGRSWQEACQQNKEHNKTLTYMTDLMVTCASVL